MHMYHRGYTQVEEWVLGLQLPLPPQLKFKKHRFCRHDIKCFMLIYPLAKIGR